LGVETESAENVVLILPKASAQRLVEARDEAGRAAAVQEGTAYLNRTPISFLPFERQDGQAIPVSVVSAKPEPRFPSAPAKLETESKPVSDYRDALARMLKDLDQQAHFVPYAPPSFIAFRGGQYLEIPIATTLAASDAGSQYKLAALAFDRHVAHLVRPVLAYFKDSVDFSGIDFSTSVRMAGANAEGGEAVEFIFPLSALRSYAQFDLTGQQLLDASVVLINGERVGLDLQTAEASVRSPD
jgi:hypothetical protein